MPLSASRTATMSPTCTGPLWNQVVRDRIGRLVLLFLEQVVVARDVERQLALLERSCGQRSTTRFRPTNT